MDEKYMQSDWIGEDKTAKSDVDLRQLINAQKTYISTLEEGMALRDNLIERYEKTIHLQEKRIELLENLLNIKDEQNKKLVGIIEDYKALCRDIAGLEEEVSISKKNVPRICCNTCKHSDLWADDEPCRSCNNCITNGCTNDLSDKWEPK